jgi:GTP-binding protein
MVIVNKWDLIDKDTKTVNMYKNTLNKSLSFMIYAPYLFISAKTGQRVHKVLELVKICYENYCKKIKTGVLNDIISRAIMMKEPPVVGNKRLKIYYVTQIDIKPPTFVFFVNDPNCIHFSYERYIENQLRENFDFTGTGIKFEFRERKD